MLGIKTQGAQWKCSPTGSMTKEPLSSPWNSPPQLLPSQVRAVGLFCHHVAISRIVPAHYGAFSNALKIPKGHLFCLLLRSARELMAPLWRWHPPSFFAFPLLTGQLVACRLREGWRSNGGVCLRWLCPDGDKIQPLESEGKSSPAG